MDRARKLPVLRRSGSRWIVPEVNDHRDQHREDGEEQVQPIGVAARLDDQPELVGIAAGPAAEGAVLGPGGPELGDSADHLEQETDDRAFHLADLRLLTKLTCQQDHDHREHDPHQERADQGQPPAIPEQQSQIEQRDQAGDQRGHDARRKPS